MSPSSGGAPHGDLQFLDIESDAFRADPLAVVSAAQKRHWLARSTRGFEVLGYDQCARMMSHENFFPGITELLSQMGGAETLDAGAGRNMQTSEGGDHGALRKAVAPWFTSRTVNGLRERTRAMIEQLVDGVMDNGRCEFHTEIAEHIPATVFCWMTGVKETYAPKVAEWSASLIKAFNGDPNDMPEIEAAGYELGQFVEQILSEKKERPGDDLISHMLEAVSSGIINETDVASLTYEMLGASSDTTSHSASLMMWLFALNPDEWRRISDDNAIIPNAVEEAMRVAPRVHSDMKVNRDAMTIDGFTFPPRSHVHFCVAAANRDPSVYSDPDQFDVGRKHLKPHLLFGRGRHQCIGATLARMELRELLGVVSAKWKTVHLDAEATLNYRDEVEVLSLPLSFDRSA